MKTKSTCICLAFFIFNTFILRAQILNPGFENWVPDVSGILYPDQWQTSNSAPDTSVFQYTPASQGNYAMRVRSWDSGFGVFGGIAYQSFPYTQRPTQFSASVRATIMPGDTAFIFFSLSHDTTLIAAPDSCTFKIFASISTWTTITLPITYISPLIPDSGGIYIMSGFPLNTQLGTEIIVDSLYFGFGTGINETATSPSAILGNNFPNPASRSTSFPLNVQRGSDVTLCMYDLLGNEIKRTEYGFLNPGQHELTISVAEIPNGVYYCSVKGNDFTVSEKITVIK